MSAARLARWALAWSTGVASVVVLRSVLGPWPAAVVIAPALLGVVVAGWASLERRMFPEVGSMRPGRQVVQLERTTSSPLGHSDVARTWALNELADHYLTYVRERETVEAHR
jgi:hypothetical protein